MFSHSLTFESSDLFDKRIQNYSDSIRLEALLNCQHRRWSPFICMMALSSVLRLPIHSFYPETGGRKGAGRHAFNLSNADIEPREKSVAETFPIMLLWSLAAGSRNDLNPSFVPNHIVPLFILKGHSNLVKVMEGPKIKQSKILFAKYKDKKSVAPTERKDNCKYEVGDVSLPHASNHSSECNEILLKQPSCEQPYIYIKCQDTFHDVGSFYLNAESLTNHNKFCRIFGNQTLNFHSHPK